MYCVPTCIGPSDALWLSFPLTLYNQSQPNVGIPSLHLPTLTNFPRLFSHDGRPDDAI